MDKILVYLDSVFTEPVDTVISHEVINNDSAVGSFLYQGKAYDFCYRNDGEIIWTEDSVTTDYIQEVAKGYLTAKGINYDSSMGSSYEVLQGYNAYRSDRTGDIGSPNKGPKQGRCPAGKSEVKSKSGKIFCRKLQKGSGSPLKAGEAIKIGSKKSSLMGNIGKAALIGGAGIAGMAALDPDAREAAGKIGKSVARGIKESAGDISRGIDETLNNLENATRKNLKYRNKLNEINEKRKKEGKKTISFHDIAKNKDKATDKKVAEAINKNIERTRKRNSNAVSSYVRKKGEQIGGLVQKGQEAASEIGKRVKSLFENNNE